MFLTHPRQHKKYYRFNFLLAKKDEKPKGVIARLGARVSLSARARVHF